jgi:hypothetical protein
MDFLKSGQDQDDDDNRHDEPSFLQRLGEYAKDEAIGAVSGAVVEHLSGGWLTSEGFDFGGDDDEYEDRAATKRMCFEARLELELAKIAPKAVDVPQTAPVEAATPPVEVPAPQTLAGPSEYAPTSRPAYQGPRGFGRKGL